MKQQPRFGAVGWSGVDLGVPIPLEILFFRTPATLMEMTALVGWGARNEPQHALILSLVLFKVSRRSDQQPRPMLRPTAVMIESRQDAHRWTPPLGETALIRPRHQWGNDAITAPDQVTLRNALQCPPVIRRIQGAEER
uniref:Uncharacterized protein n=1 Tax=Candidatus Kentrum sp. LPFa TaxID=2126335 RepID=A0A450WWV4_9GAMM|nr:MAG: hypothetical protein BECKLPF1236B_GA0070989_12593 [Candidatus Kentron sp. LPFa]